MNKKKTLIAETTSTTEFATPSEILEVVKYIAKHYLIDGKIQFSDSKQHIKLQYSQTGRAFEPIISPLSGAWDESLPEDKIVIRGVVCQCENGSIAKSINQLNSDHPDIKLYIDNKEVVLDRIFSMTGGVTINHLIETILEFAANQSLLNKALQP
ncbi:hypothetical protein [Aliidiomarina quisquiliarum]|uniref:hypothetical protein n=1 Tax=Aliidiomarina quisquiliarum TaxID=2938947 RepID=UPI00208EAFC5|nr:hypothetical protein [Aliidiomarina quisquiliarum]MCO4319892.1 hypothetical protein [Aliidiomarina quisquiliarum]